MCLHFPRGAEQTNEVCFCRQTVELSRLPARPPGRAFIPREHLHSLDFASVSDPSPLPPPSNRPRVTTKASLSCYPRCEAVPVAQVMQLLHPLGSWGQESEAHP